MPGRTGPQCDAAGICYSCLITWINNRLSACVIFAHRIIVVSYHIILSYKFQLSFSNLLAADGKSTGDRRINAIYDAEQ